MSTPLPADPGLAPVGLRLSFRQEGLWYAEQIAPGTAARYVSATLIEGPLDDERLGAALRACASRHDLLRSCFEATADGPRRILERDTEVFLRRLDLSPVKVETQRAVSPQVALRRAVAEELAAPLAAERAPLLRAVLISTGQTSSVLLLVAHPLIADHASLAVLERDLASTYVRSAPTSSGAPLRTLAGPAQGATYDEAVVREREEHTVDLAYWMRQLAGLTALALPTDRLRPRAPDQGATSRSFRIGEQTTRGLRRLAGQEAVALGTVLSAGFAVLLSRYTRETDVVFGRSVDRRRAPHEQDAFGPYEDLLVLRTDLSGRPSFREVVRRAEQVHSQAEHHGRVPFGRLVELLVDEPDSTRHPLCQAVLTVTEDRPAPGGPGRTGFNVERLVTSRLRLDPVAAPYDLHWVVGEDDRPGLAAELVAAEALWRPESVDRMTKVLCALLAALVLDADRPVDDLPVLPSADRALLEAWNDTGREQPDPVTVHGLFRRWAVRTPDRPALNDRTRRWTYGQLERRANQLALELASAGVGTDTPVALHLERSADLVAGMLGVLMAGGATVVLDPSYPHERLRLMADDAQIRAVVSRSTPPSWLRCRGVPVIRLSEVDRAVGLRGRPGTDDQRAPSRGDPDSLACVVYTSGSTGRPKGVGIPHRAVVRLITATDYITIRPDDVLLHLGDPAFDITAFEVWGALCNGAQVAVLPGDEPLGPDEVLTALREVRPTVVALTGTLFNRVVDIDPLAFGGLRHLFVVGEVMDPRRTRLVLAAGAPPEHLHNGYGPSENATFSTTYRADLLPDDLRAVPIGAPITNTTAHVLDQALHPVPIGMAGELFVGGLGLARGYLGRPDLTADLFLPDPFASAPGARMYRTGDLVRTQSDGAMEFLGRVDKQVKIRGYRIEPGEVEAALLSQPDVGECVVQAVDVGEDRRLVAYVVPTPGRILSVPAIIGDLRDRVSSFMVPNHVVLLQQMPLTTSGKIDVRALPCVSGNDARLTEDDTVPPRTATERELWTIWAEALGARMFGVHDGFFLIGGHSLLASVVRTAIRERLGVELPLRALFDISTIAGLAAEIDRQGPSEQAGPPDELHALVTELVRLSEERNAEQRAERDNR